MLETRERLRKAAWELFSTAGFEATTTNAIAKRAGVASGTVFVHASDKADLLFLVMHDRLAAAVEEGFAADPGGSLLDRLMAVFVPIFRTYTDHPAVAAAFVRFLPGARGPNAERTNTMTLGFLVRLSRLVADAQRGGEVAPDLDPLACAQNVFGLYFMALMAWISGHVTLEEARDRVLQQALALQIRGFRA